MLRCRSSRAAAAAAAAAAAKLQTLLDFLAFCMPSFSTATTTKQEEEDDDDDEDDNHLSDQAEEDQDDDEGQQQTEATVMHVLQTFQVLMKKVVTAAAITTTTNTATMTMTAALDYVSLSNNNNHNNILLLLLLPLLLSNLVKLIMPSWCWWGTTMTTTSSRASFMIIFFQNLSWVPNQHFPGLVHDLVVMHITCCLQQLPVLSSSQRQQFATQQQQQQQNVALVTALRKEFAKRQEQPAPAAEATAAAVSTAQQQEQQRFLVHSAMIFLKAILPQQQHSSSSLSTSITPLQEFSSLHDYSNDDASYEYGSNNNNNSTTTTTSSPAPPSPLAKAYLHVLQEEIIAKRQWQQQQQQQQNNNDNSSSSTLCILDVAVVLALSSSLSSQLSNDEETTTSLAAQSLVDAWCCDGDLYCTLFFQHLQSLLQVVVPFGIEAATATVTTMSTTASQQELDNTVDNNNNNKSLTTDVSLASLAAALQNVVNSIHDQVIQPSLRKLAIFLCLTPTRRRQRRLGSAGSGGNYNNNNLFLQLQVQTFWIQLYDALGNNGKHHHHDDDDENNDHGQWQHRQQGLVRSLLQLLVMPTAIVHHAAADAADDSNGNNANNNNNNNNTAHHVWVYKILQDLIRHSQWQQQSLLMSSSRLNITNDHDYYFACFVRQSLTQRLVTMGGGVVHDHNDDDDDNFSMAQLCSVLVLLWGAQEGMNLVQKLLFSSIGVGCKNSKRNNPSLKGLLLATAMVQSKCLRDKEMHDMKDWVLRILLPVSGRMAEPELGTQGLAFLLAWNKQQQQQILPQHQHEKNGHDDDDDALSSKRKKKSTSSSTNNQIFDDIKVLIGNTGLVQSLAHYHQHGSSGRQSNSDTTILGYRTTHKLFEDNGSNNNKPSSLAQTAGKKTSITAATREMVFCVAFFLRHMDSHEPNRWQHAARWVFDLVNTYLQIGREKAKSRWVPYGWLQAAVEFPKIEFDFFGASVVTGKQKENVASWLQLELFTFEVDKGENINDDASPSDSKRALCAELFTRDIDAGKMSRLRDSFYHYTFGLYTAIGLSSAVLKNVFAHVENLASWSTCEDFSDESNSLLRLVACQILKLYDLRKKTTSTVLLLASLESALKRRRAKRATANSTAHDNADDVHSNDEVGTSTLEEDVLESALEVTYTGPLQLHQIFWGCLNILVLTLLPFFFEW